MRIVIIGGGHFPTVNILFSLLEKNPAEQIFVLDDNLKNLPVELKKNPQVTFWQGTAKDEILLKNLLSNAQVLINLIEADNIENYVSKVSNVFKFAEDSNIERIIHISSSRVYGNVEDSPVTEEHPTKPADLKGAMDILGEKLAYYYGAQYSLPVVILRTFNVYGPYESLTSTIPSLITTALKDKPLQLWDNGDQTENLLFVEDLTSAIQKILKVKFDSLKGEIINIGNLGGTTIKEIASIVLSKLGKPQSLITYERKNKQDSFFLVPSIMKAKVLLSWSPKVEIEEGLEKTISWYINNRNWWETK
jgi:nucleoside-diphosphate-sugar epimerase